MTGIEDNLEMSAGNPAIRACPLCGGGRGSDFFTLRQVPVHVCVLFDTPRQAREAPLGDVVLSYCHDCGFVHNRAFDPGRISFEPGYEASLWSSGLFSEYLQGLADRLIEQHGLRGKRIIEVGCGAGEFLRLLCERGGNRGVGFDPALPVHTAEQDGPVRFIRDYFTPRHADLPCDFLCCLSVMEDIPLPVEFARQLRVLTAAGSPRGYFEVFNAWRAYEKLETWSVLYEQCSQYSARTFAEVFRRAGWRVLQSGTCYADDQYVYVEVAAEGEPAAAQPAPPPETDGELPAALREFAVRHEERVRWWRGRIAACRAAGQRVVLWGAAGKGINFLTALRDLRAVDCVVDSNPRRQEKFMPGTAEAVIAPEALRQRRPDLIVISNGIYEREIRAQATALGVQAEFAVA